MFGMTNHKENLEIICISEGKKNKLNWIFGFDRLASLLLRLAQLDLILFAWLHLAPQLLVMAWSSIVLAFFSGLCLIFLCNCPLCVLSCPLFIGFCESLSNMVLEVLVHLVFEFDSACIAVRPCSFCAAVGVPFLSRMRELYVCWIASSSICWVLLLY